jgi:hypothetical protein
MIGFIGSSLQLQSIMTAHNWWLSTTRSIPYWTPSFFCVTDLVLIYEWVTSSPSVVRWWTLHSWTLKYWTAFWILLRNESLLRMTSVFRINSTPVRVRVRVTLRLAVYRQSVPLGAEPLETHDKQFFPSIELLRPQSLHNILSDEKMGLLFTIGVGPRQRIHSRVGVPWDSRPYFTVSDSRLPFLSPPTTRRVTVKLFDLASTRERLNELLT